METLEPRDAGEVLDALRWAVAEEQPLELVGNGTKRGLGRPFQATHTLDLSALSGIVSYEPEELVLTVRAGTPLAEVEALLADRRQQLAFEPADWGPLFGAEPGRQTVGGAIACNLSGPRRIKAGAARDHLLGFEAVSGRAERYKAGGRVVKNVTGYDLCKLLAGSHGTISALTEVTVKVLPAPERTRTVLLLGLDDAAGVAALTRALQGSFEAAGAAHLPAPVAAASGVPAVAAAGAAVTAVRIEGFGPSVDYRAGRLVAELGGLAPAVELDDEASAAFWREVRDAAAFTRRPERIVWRLSVPPSQGPRVAAEIAARLDAEWFYDWGGGLLWVALAAAGEDAGAGAVRGAAGPNDGHATLLRAPETLRASVAVFHPQPAALAALSARVKAGFDPKRILNPGRMWAGV
ncbi:glycolate oxidase subunit GlcE [Arenibaculum sp.]|uniref:glycolate oxidase subunit GlcE n=1 Tax=Arenibaculum sp. TaxID=2865862 RepID=UPI002E15B80A|nr:glycolate oxidase subunit GlcE [Arenibaculum sp.]